MFFHVVDTDAQSHAHRSVNAVLATAKKEKKRNYTQVAQACHASFSPFVLMVDGLMARKARFVVQRIATALSTKWSKSYGVVMGWVQTRMSFAILQAMKAWKMGQGLP